MTARAAAAPDGNLLAREVMVRGLPPAHELLHEMLNVGDAAWVFVYPDRCDVLLSGERGRDVALVALAAAHAALANPASRTWTLEDDGTWFLPVVVEGGGEVWPSWAVEDA